jgi:1-acyl-sn-glycerol-3-phosphate acyltransferase
VLAAELGPVFVAKSEVEDWPVLGVLARSIGTIFVDRRVKRDSLRALDRIDRAIAAGRSVVLFAEGTSSRGAEVGPMKPALLEWAARRRYPVRYASLSYRTETGDPPADLAVCWWGDMTFLDHLAGLCRLNRFHATVRFGEEALEDDDRTRLAERLRYAVAQQFTPVVKSTPN